MPLALVPSLLAARNSRPGGFREMLAVCNEMSSYGSRVPGGRADEIAATVCRGAVIQPVGRGGRGKQVQHSKAPNRLVRGYACACCRGYSARSCWDELTIESLIVGRGACRALPMQ